MPKLRVARGRSTAEEFLVRDEVVIGRAEDCDVRVFDESASRRHTAIRREGEEWFAVDLGSTNGTFVNGARADRRALRTGDEVSVRGLTLVFLEDGAAERKTVLAAPSSASEPTEEEALARLAHLYRFTAILGRDTPRRRAEILRHLEETFAPCRAALLLRDANAGTFSRALVDEMRRTRGPVRDDAQRAMAAPLGDYGALHVDRPDGSPFRPADLDLLAALANAAAPALRPADAPAPPERRLQELLGESAAMKRLKDEIERVARTDATILVTGETGTGKELVARAIHAWGARGRQPFVAVNCAAFVETLLESELFGHEKGAFTGADRARPGRFEQAHGGTIFLDEVGELAPGLQAKLLRVLETREFHRVGATKPTRVDVRIVAATNRDLKATGFREDLYYRLSVVTLVCPPLRERKDDIPLLVRTFLGNRRITDAAMAKLGAYPWPGNVRELKNVCERCVVLARAETIEVDDLPLEVRIGRAADTAGAPVRTLREMEREMVVRALEATGGNRTQAAKLLGITYPTLKKKIDEG